MFPRPQTSRSKSFAGFAPLVIGLMALGCDNVTARSFGGNSATGGQTGDTNGGLGRGRGGSSGTIDITSPTGGTSGATQMPAAVGGAGGTGVAIGGSLGTLPTGTGGAPGGFGPVSSGGAAGGASPGTGNDVGSGGVPAAATGGVSATGARPGSGGTPAATGGVSATGGTPGSGGVAASGGVTSSGGTMGPGGAPGPGGRPGGGPAAGGAGGGTQVASDAMCSQYISDYDAALVNAKMCTGDGKSCGKAVPAALSGCAASCDTYVDDDALLKDIQKKWDKAGCVGDSCPIVLCINPTSGSCSITGKTDGGNGKDKKGTCTDSLLGL